MEQFPGVHNNSISWIYMSKWSFAVSVSREPEVIIHLPRSCDWYGTSSSFSSFPGIPALPQRANYLHFIDKEMCKTHGDHAQPHRLPETGAAEGPTLEGTSPKGNTETQR